MRRRRETVEHPFGTMKARMGATDFLTKTLQKVAAEMALSVLVYKSYTGHEHCRYQAADRCDRSLRHPGLLAPTPFKAVSTRPRRERKSPPQTKQMAEYRRLVLTCVQSRLECVGREDGRWQCHDFGA